MFTAILFLVAVHLTSTTSQRHGIDQELEQEQSRGTFAGQVSSSDITADNYSDDEEDIALDSLWPLIRHAAPSAAKRAPWAPSEVRFDQLMKKLRSQTYKNRDKHNTFATRGTATDHQNLRRAQRSQTSRDVIAVDRLLVPVDNENQRTASFREFTGPSDVAGKYPVSSERRRAPGVGYRIKNGNKYVEFATSNQRSNPVYWVSGSSDVVQVPVLSFFD